MSKPVVTTLWPLYVPFHYLVGFSQVYQLPDGKNVFVNRHNILG